MLIIPYCSREFTLCVFSGVSECGVEWSPFKAKMLSKRSLFKYALLYNFAGIVLNLITDLLLPEIGTTLSLKPIISESIYVQEISNRLLHSSAKTRPAQLLHSNSHQQYIIEGNYGTRNIAWPWMVHYAKDYVSHFAYYKELS